MVIPYCNNNSIICVLPCAQASTRAFPGFVLVCGSAPRSIIYRNIS